MARPKPCAAPVTIAVWPEKSTVHDVWSRASSGAQGVERRERLGPDPALDLVDQLDQPGGERRRHPGLGAEASPRCRAGRRLRSAAFAPRGPARCRCATWPSGGCGPPTVERRVPRRPAGALGSRPRDRSRRTPRAEPTARRRHGEDLPGQGDVQTAILGQRQRVGDRLVGERGGEEHRAVGFLAPEVAPDVGRHDRGGARSGATRRESRRPGASWRPSISPTTTAPRPAVVNHARLQVVGAEVDERADRARRRRPPRRSQLVEPVLSRHHLAGGAEVREQRAEPRLRCDAPWWPGRSRPRCRRASAGVKAGTRTVNSSIGPVMRRPASADRVDVLGDRIDDRDVLAGARQIGAQRAADGARAPDQRSLAPCDDF